MTDFIFKNCNREISRIYVSLFRFLLVAIILILYDCYSIHSKLEQQIRLYCSFSSWNHRMSVSHPMITRSLLQFCAKTHHGIISVIHRSAEKTIRFRQPNASSLLIIARITSYNRQHACKFNYSSPELLRSLITPYYDDRSRGNYRQLFHKKETISGRTNCHYNVTLFPLHWHGGHDTAFNVNTRLKPRRCVYGFLCIGETGEMRALPYNNVGEKRRDIRITFLPSPYRVPRPPLFVPSRVTMISREKRETFRRGVCKKERHPDDVKMTPGNIRVLHCPSSETLEADSEVARINWLLRLYRGNITNIMKYLFESRKQNFPIYFYIFSLKILDKESIWKILDATF